MGTAQHTIGRGRKRPASRPARLLAKLLAAVAVGLCAAGVLALPLAGGAPAPRAAGGGHDLELVIENVSTPDGPEPAFVGPDGVGAPVLVDLVAATRTTITIVNKTDLPHTLTSPALGLDVPVPPGPSTVHVRVTPRSPGLFTWECDLPCGPFVMSHTGYMKGEIKVRPQGAAAEAHPPAKAGSAGHPQDAKALSLTARQIPGKAPAVRLVARLDGPRPSASRGAGVRVYFSLRLTELGSPLLSLGSATTDGSGVATLTYAPTWRGRQRLVAAATSATGRTLSATTAIATTTAAHPLASLAEARRPDGGIGQVVVGVLLGLLAVLWIVLISVVVRVNLGLRKSR